MEYRVSAWLQVFIWIFALAICGVLITVLAAPAGINKAIIIVAVLIMAIFLVLAAINISKTVLYINNAGITLTSLFRNRSLPISSIRGYRLIATSKSSRLIFIPANKLDKQIAIAVDNFKHSKAIIEYAKNNFQDIDKLLYEEEMEELLQDERLGFSPEERRSFLAVRKGIAIALNITAVASVFIIFFSKSSGVIWQVLPLAFPVFALLLVGLSRGVVLLIGKAKSPRSTVLLAFILPPVFFLIYGISSHRLYSLEFFWTGWIKWSAVVFIAFALLFFGFAKRVNERGVIFLLIGIALIYGAGSLIFFNSYLDKSRPSVYRVAVLNKWKQKSKSTSYYLSLSEWGKNLHGERESVSRSLWDAVNIGDTLKILVNTGKYNIPWYSIKTDDALIGRIPAN